jgi:hypothetical protein
MKTHGKTRNVDDEVNAVVKLLLGVQGELVKKIDDMGG